MRCGLLGRKLSHSYSPQIHSLLGDYAYTLYEKEPEEIADFLKSGDFNGINVTIPYKREVIPYLDALSPLAEKLGSVNTIVRNADGRLIGHNTDYFGFISMVEKSGLNVPGKKCMVLGSGGVSKPVVAALTAMGANVIVISHKENTPDNLKIHSDTSIIINTTPVGMFPHNGDSPVDLSLFPCLEGVLDLIFNPAKTALMLQAEARGLTSMGGLWMLVAQAKEAAEWFTGNTIDNDVITNIHKQLQFQMRNIILIGMPGSGKSTIGKLLSEKLSREFIDSDKLIEEMAGITIPEIFSRDGEVAFRRWESAALNALGKRSSLVIATGGGCVTQQDNYSLLHQNGIIIWLIRDLKNLPTNGRPLSQTTPLSEMFAQRKPMYEFFCDMSIDNNVSCGETVTAILNRLDMEDIL